MLELILVMALTGILLAAMAPMMLKSKTDEKFLQKVQEEIESRQNAARWYYNDYNAWPGSAANLKAPVANAYNPSGTPYLDPGCSETSAFGTNYVLSSTSNTFSVAVNAPADLAAETRSKTSKRGIYGRERLYHEGHNKCAKAGERIGRG